MAKVHNSLRTNYLMTLDAEVQLLRQLISLKEIVERLTIV